MELISVIMPVYKESPAFLKTAVESIQKQQYSKIEFIIIVDNPKNKEAINYLREIKKKDKRLKVYINSKNQGIVYSLNKGLRFSHGNLIARMDADDYSYPDRLNMELNYLKKNNYDLVGSYYKLFNSEGKLTKKINLPTSFDELKRNLKFTNYVAHSSWLAKKSVFEELQGYRNVPTCEDYDFLTRLCLKKFRFGNVPSYLLNYRFDSEGISNRNKSKQIIISDLIARQYRHNKILNLKKLNQYLNSNKYLQRIKAEDKILNWKAEYKNSNKKEKIKILFKLLVKKEFINRQILSVLYGYNVDNN